MQFVRPFFFFFFVKSFHYVMSMLNRYNLYIYNMKTKLKIPSVSSIYFCRHFLDFLSLSLVKLSIANLFWEFFLWGLHRIPINSWITFSFNLWPVLSNVAIWSAVLQSLSSRSWSSFRRTIVHTYFRNIKFPTIQYTIYFTHISNLQCWKLTVVRT